MDMSDAPDPVVTTPIDVVLVMYGASLGAGYVEVSQEPEAKGPPHPQILEAVKLTVHGVIQT
jgi:hypothetical protein